MIDMCRYLFHFSMRVRWLCSSFTKCLLSIYHMPSRIILVWICYQEKGISKGAPTGRDAPSLKYNWQNVGPARFKILSRCGGRRMIPNPAYRSFLVPPSKDSYGNAANNTVAYVNEIETALLLAILPNVLELSSQIRQWIYSATPHRDCIKCDVTKQLCSISKQNPRMPYPLGKDTGILASFSLIK